MDDLISRQAAIDAILQRLDALKGLSFGTSTFRDGIADGYARIMSDLKALPSAQPSPENCWGCNCPKMVPSADVPERNVGKWLEREVIHAKEAKAIITDWQSCKCSACGCYDTRPYLYCFNEPRFCSWCGAEMKVKDEDATD